MKLELRVRSISELTDSVDSVLERGILITLLLLKREDDSSEILWTRFKQGIKISKEIRKGLVNLQELELIDWSGYLSAKATQEKELLTKEVREVISFSNQVWGTNRQVRSNLAKVILPRLKEYKIDEIKLVISNRYLKWNNDPTMKDHLVLETVLRPSLFPKYLDEALRTKQGSSIVVNEKIKLTKGDLILPEIFSNIIDSEVYPIREQGVNIEGNLVGIPVPLNKTGKQLKSYLNSYKRTLARGGVFERVLIYWPEN